MADELVNRLMQLYGQGGSPDGQPIRHPDLVNALAQTYAQTHTQGADRNGLAGDPSIPPPSPYENVMEQARSLHSNLTHADPVEMAMGLLGPNARGAGALARNVLPMDLASRMARAKEMGLDTPAFHATGAEFDQFKPHPYRGASFFARTPEDARRGATAGANDMTGSGSSRMMNVMLPSDEIHGLALTPAEREWWSSIPDRVGEGQVNAIVKTAPGHEITDWYRVYDEIKHPDGTFSYAKMPMPKLDWETASRTNRDVYGKQFPHYGKGSEAYSSEQAKKHGMAGYAHQDEAGLSIGMVDPRRIRSTDAAFDPENRYSPNLLAGLAGAAAIPGLALLGRPDDGNR